MADLLTKWLTLLFRDWPTDWKIYGRLIEWLTYSYLEILYDWPYCLGIDQVTEWFKADYLTDKLTLLSRDWLTDWVIYG